MKIKEVGFTHAELSMMKALLDYENHYDHAQLWISIVGSLLTKVSDLRDTLEDKQILVCKIKKG